MNSAKTQQFNVLAVDDEAVVIDLYQEILASADDLSRSFSPVSFNLVDCDQADKAVKAVQKAVEENRPFSVAFLDIHMPPGPNGVWAAEEIRKVDPNIEIVLVTGHARLDILETARRVKPIDKLLYLQKPFYPQEILQFANALSAKWQTESELRHAQSGLEMLVQERTASLEEANQQLRMEIKNRVSAENAARISEQKFRNIIRFNSDGIILLDQEGMILFANPAAEKLFGVPSKRLIGSPFGHPYSENKTTEIDIVGKETDQKRVAELRVVKTKWEGKVVNLASLRDVSDRKRMEKEIKSNLQMLENAMKGTIQAMARTVETRDPYTAGHQQRVADLCLVIAKKMYLPSDQIEGIQMAATIHDIGKFSVPAEILSKPGKLTETEFKLIQAHVEAGYNILKEIDFPWPIAQIVYQHHERLNGSGYPRGLSDPDILTGARILGVADVVEAMANHRPYRPALSIEEAIEEISNHKDTHYDSRVVDACIELLQNKDFTFQS